MAGRAILPAIGVYARMYGMLTMELVAAESRSVDLLLATPPNTLRLEEPFPVSIDVHHLHYLCREAALRDQHHRVLEILEPIPLEVIHEDQDRAFWRALALLSTVQYARSKQAVDEFENRFVTPEDRLAMGRFYMMQSHLHIMDGDAEASYEMELKAAAEFPQDAYLERLRCWATIDTLAGHIGDDAHIERAVVELNDARDHLPFDQSWWYSFVVPNRSDLLLKRGALSQAETLLDAQLSSIPVEEISIILLRLAVIALEHLDLRKANVLMSQIAEELPASYWNTEAYLVRAQVQRYLGHTEEAIRILREAMTVRAQNHSRAEYFRAQMQLCEIWIEMGDIELAEAWVGLASRSIDQWPRSYGHPIPKLILAELAMVKGEWKDAITLLNALREEGERRKHTGILVGIYAHLAYASAHAGSVEEASEFAERAVLAGREGNFARSLRVLGRDVRTYLKTSPQQIDPASPIRATRSLVLSAREIEVLTLAAEGMRNAEIAETLFISLSTVKNHMARIFKSLGARDRNEAIQTARRMGLLE